MVKSILWEILPLIGASAIAPLNRSDLRIAVQIAHHLAPDLLPAQEFAGSSDCEPPRHAYLTSSILIFLGHDGLLGENCGQTRSLGKPCRQGIGAPITGPAFAGMRQGMECFADHL